MRLVSAVLLVALTGSGALADEAKPADSKPEVTRHKVPFRVVKMLPETGQVLLFDRDRGSHVVAEVGQTIDGYRVDDLDDETVTLVAENGTQILLAAPPPPRPARPSQPRTRPADPYAADASDDDAAPPSSTTASSAPAAATRGADGPGTPVDPYAEPAPPTRPGEGGVRVATAAPPATALVEDDPYADPGIAAFADAVGATPAPAGSPPAPASATPPPARPASPAAGTHAPADDTGSALASALTGAAPPASTASPPAATTPPAGATGPADAAAVAPPPPDLASLSADEPATTPASATVPRGELDAALADFGALAASFRATFTPAGLRFDALREGTLLTRIGLRKGDVITSVDGQPLRSLDDAANLYARASSLRAATVQVTRAGRPITLRVAIR